MTRITQLDSNLLLRIFLRAPATLYLNSRLRRLAIKSETVYLKSLDGKTLTTLQVYSNIKRIVCKWWKMEQDQVLPPSLTSLCVANTVWSLHAISLPIQSLKNLVDLTIISGGAIDIEARSLPKSLTRLHIGKTYYSHYGLSTGIITEELPHLANTNLLFGEDNYNPILDPPVTSVLDGTNTSITMAVVLATNTGVDTSSLHLYKNLTRLCFYSNWPVGGDTIATLSNLVELRCENLTGRWGSLLPLTKLHTAIVNINSEVCLDRSPPNLTYLSVRAECITRAWLLGGDPPLLTLHIRGGDFTIQLIEEYLPTTLRVLSIEPLITNRIRRFSTRLTSLILRIKDTSCMRSLPSTLTALNVGNVDIHQGTQLPLTLRVIRSRSITGTFYLPNFRRATCSIDPGIIRREGGMVEFCNTTKMSKKLPSCLLYIVIGLVFVCLDALLGYYHIDFRIHF